MRYYAHIIPFMHDTPNPGQLPEPPGKVSIAAVVFDYGNVLGLEQTLSDMESMARICRIPTQSFIELYWKLRPPYDRGEFDGPEYWASVARQHELGFSEDQIASLVALDGVSISRPNLGTVQWVKLLHAAGIPLGLLSNMPLELSRYVTRNFPAVSAFDHLVFSCDHGSIKPESMIFHKCLEVLNTDPKHVLYLDDRSENVDAGSRAGIHSVLFDTFEETAQRVAGRFDIPVPPCVM